MLSCWPQCCHPDPSVEQTKCAARGTFAVVENGYLPLSEGCRPLSQGAYTDQSSTIAMAQFTSMIIRATEEMTA